MKTTIFALAAVGGFTFAQFSDIPECAQECLSSAVSAAGCPANDVGCQCSSTAEIQGGAGGCILDTCTRPGELQSAINGGGALCSDYLATASASVTIESSTSTPTSAVSTPSRTVTRTRSTTSRASSTSSVTSIGVTVTPTRSGTTTSTSTSTQTSPLAENTQASSKGGLSTGAVAGISVAGTLGGIAILALIAFLIWRRRKRGSVLPQPDVQEKPSELSAEERTELENMRVSELGAYSVDKRYEMGGGDREELEARRQRQNAAVELG